MTILMGMVICAAAAKALKAFLKHTRYTVSQLQAQTAQTLPRAVLRQSLPRWGQLHAKPDRSAVRVEENPSSKLLKERQAYLARMVKNVPHSLYMCCRPASLCERLGNCHEYGMPSSHTQLMFFAFVTYLLLITRVPASTLPAVRWQRTIHFLQGAALAALSAAVACSRVYLGYHSVSQVCTADTLPIPNSCMCALKPMCCLQPLTKNGSLLQTTWWNASACVVRTLLAERWRAVDIKRMHGVRGSLGKWKSSPLHPVAFTEECARMQVLAGAVIGSALALAWFWVVSKSLAEDVFPALLQWWIVKMLCFKDVWRENPDEVLYKEMEWYSLRNARKKIR